MLLHCCRPCPRPTRIPLPLVPCQMVEAAPGQQQQLDTNTATYTIQVRAASPALL